MRLRFSPASFALKKLLYTSLHFWHSFAQKRLLLEDLAKIAPLFCEFCLLRGLKCHILLTKCAELYISPVALNQLG